MDHQMNSRTVDQIIDANMTVTDHLLRDAIHAVVVDATYQAAAEEREACARLLEQGTEMSSLAGDPAMQKFTATLLSGFVAAIRAR